MKGKLNADQSSHKVLKITPFIPLTLRGKEDETTSVLVITLLRLVLSKVEG
jgi:hypothetical protein